MKEPVKCCCTLRVQVIVNNKVVRLHENDPACVLRQTTFVNARQITTHCVIEFARYRVCNSWLIIESRKLRGVRNRLTLRITIKKNCIMTNCLSKKRFVVRILVIVRPASFRHEVLAESSQEKRTLI